METEFSKKQGEFLLKIAKNAIYNKIHSQTKNIIQDENKLKDICLNEKHGTFVTLYKHGNLRGCIGTLEPVESIIEGIKTNAINAAFNDPRFSPVNKNEIKDLDIEISILTKPEPLIYKNPTDLLSKLKVNIHGVIIKKNRRKATFLPQVWEQLPDKKEFLSHLCIKAGLSSKEWKKKGLEVMVYYVQSFKA